HRREAHPPSPQPPRARPRPSVHARLLSHMRQALKSILFDDHDKKTADAARRSIVTKARRSKAADRNPATKRTDDDLPVHSFRSLIADLATVTHNTMATVDHPDATFVLYPQLTNVQARVFQLLDVPVRL